MKLSQAQLRTLLFLKDRRYATPQEIGYAITVGRERPMKPQGAGRVGGGIAAKLGQLGLVESAAFLRQGYPAYRITGRGLALLTEGDRS